MSIEKPEAIITPPQGKRVVATTLLGLGGFGLMYYGTQYYWNQGEIFFLYMLAVGTFFFCYKLYKTTKHSIFLMKDCVVSSSGELLFEVSNINSIDNGIFSFKPSNGALVHLKSPMKGAFRIGLWWRAGRSVGIGGCTRRAEVNHMVDLIRNKIVK